MYSYGIDFDKDKDLERLIQEYLEERRSKAEMQEEKDTFVREIPVK